MGYYPILVGGMQWARQLHNMPAEPRRRAVAALSNIYKYQITSGYTSAYGLGYVMADATSYFYKIQHSPLLLAICHIYLDNGKLIFGALSGQGY